MNDVSLRNYFAGKALLGLLSANIRNFGIGLDSFGIEVPITITQRAFELADAMIQEGENNE